jgi:transcriptional regulator with XRE-family HTH domain
MPDRDDDFGEYLEGLGGRLAAARIAKGWTMTRLGEEAGMGYPTISRYERGVREPGAYNLSILCFALGANANQILDI